MVNSCNAWRSIYEVNHGCTRMDTDFWRRKPTRRSWRRGSRTAMSSARIDFPGEACFPVGPSLNRPADFDHLFEVGIAGKTTRQRLLVVPAGEFDERRLLGEVHHREIV